MLEPKRASRPWEGMFGVGVGIEIETAQMYESCLGARGRELQRNPSDGTYDESTNGNMDQSQEVLGMAVHK